MARITALLHTFALAQQRRRRREQSGSTQLLTFLCGAGLLYAWLTQLWLTARNPAPLRRSASEQILLFGFALLWLFIPLTNGAAWPEGRLQLWPLHRMERGLLSCARLFAGTQTILLGCASLLTCAVFLAVDPKQAALFLASLCAACLCGTALVCTGEAFTTKSSTTTHRLLNRFDPLLRKEIFALAHTLDPWLGLLVATLAAASEVFTSWMTPHKATAVFLFVALCQSTAPLAPFALDDEPQRERYRLLPVSYAAIVARKHAAAALLLLVSLAPLLVTLAWRQSLADLAESLLLLGAVCSGLLLTGVTLMDLRGCQRIRMRPDRLSGEGLSLDLALAAIAILVAPALLAVLPTLGAPWLNRFLVSGAALALCGTIYPFCLARRCWPRVH